MTSNDIATKVKNEVLETYPKNGTNIVIPAPDNYSFQLTSTSNEMRFFRGYNLADNNHMSIINLGDCETLLKQSNHIPPDSSLIMLKYEKQTGVASKKSIQYEVYGPNGKKLNLSICNQTDIDIAIPVSVDEDIQNLYADLNDDGFNLFDRYSNFYIDICTPYTAENGADV
jgi:hypothetical protein